MTDPRRPARRAFGVATASEGDRVTTLELFFDLVYVFAFTQVTYLMSHGEAPTSLLAGLIILSLLWFAWCSYSWLANQAHADEGALQVAFVVAMVAVFIACLAIPELFHEIPEGFSAAATMVICYAVVRLAHAGFYLLAARDDAQLRRQVILTVVGSLIPTITLLAVGAAAGEPAQLWIWLAAVLYDFISVFVTAVRGAGWRIRSAAHFAERHGLIVILALGESIVAIGVGLAGEPIDTHIVVGAVLSLMISLGLWFAYFRRVAHALEHALDAAQGRSRARLGQDVFTYFHFPIIAGIMLAALGAEQAMAHLDEDHLGPLGGWALGGGIALFLAGTVAAMVRSRRDWMPVRIGAVVVLVAICPLLAATPPLVSVGIVALVLLALAVADTLARRGGRDEVTATATA